MKILLYSLGATKMGGAARHLKNFLPELARQDTSRRYVLMVRETFYDLKSKENIYVERIPDKLAAGWSARILRDIVSLPKRLKREKFDVIVSLGNFGPIWAPVPHILFQRNPIYFCRIFLKMIKGRQKVEILMRQRLIVECIKRADLIVTPSNTMADMILETCPQVKNRAFRTLYHGYNPKNLDAEDLDSSILDKLNQRPRFKLLYPTNPAPHKGFEILFPALAILKQKRQDFSFFLPMTYEESPVEISRYISMISKYGLNDFIVFIGRVKHEQMGRLYKECDLMVFPSLCESFGFPLIEAIGSGLPLLVSGTEIHRELCEEAALYYPPNDSEALAKAIDLQLSEKRKLDPVAADRVLHRMDWGWERYTREFLDIIKIFE